MNKNSDHIGKTRYIPRKTWYKIFNWDKKRIDEFELMCKEQGRLIKERLLNAKK